MEIAKVHPSLTKEVFSFREWGAHNCDHKVIILHGYKIELTRLCWNHNIFCIIFEFVRLSAITKFVALWMATQLILQDFNLFNYFLFFFAMLIF
jgi:hypothetical protein